MFISVICWAIPVVISISVDPNYYITQSNTSSDFCFISNAGVFFGAFLAPIFLVIIVNACVAVCTGYVITKHKQEMKQAASIKKQQMPWKEAWKLLLTLVGFMILLGLSWIILLFTVVGADTNIYAAFAIQWLFVFFNSLQGFFIYFFFIVINPDMQNEWKTFLTASCSFSFKNKESSSAKYRCNQHSTISATSTKSSKTTLKAATVLHLHSEKNQELMSDRNASDNLTLSGNAYIETV